MKRWNQKGSIHANRRMAELRDHKAQLVKSDLIATWMQKNPGRAGREWWADAQAAGLKTSDPVSVKIEWLRSQVAA